MSLKEKAHSGTSKSKDIPSGELLDPEREPASPERTQRLRLAVDEAGKNKAVADRAGVPVGTLNHYLRGRDPKFGAMIALAEATGVRLEWLATGAGPMRAGRAEEASSLPASPAPTPFRLFGHVKIDRLVRAYEGALASSGGDKRLTMHLTVVLHDQLADAEEAAGV